jgi:hypothetical protein
MCAALADLSFVEIPVGQDFKSLFKTKSDAMNTSASLFYTFTILITPYICHRVITNNFATLHTSAMKLKIGVFYEDNRINTKDRAMYNYYFLRRRLLSVLVLVFGTAFPFF